MDCFWREPFGEILLAGKILAGNFWWNFFSGKIWAGNFLAGTLGREKILAGNFGREIYWQEVFGGNSLAGYYWQDNIDGKLFDCLVQYIISHLAKEFESGIIKSSFDNLKVLFKCMGALITKRQL